MKNRKEWRPIPEFESYYEISSDGRVRSIRSGQLLGIRRINQYGHIGTTLSLAGVHKTITLHRVLAKVFIDNPFHLTQVRHLDGNPQNNDLSNLAWGSSKDNHQDMIIHGNHHQINKVVCPRGHNLSEPNLDRWTLINRKSRSCLACKKTSQFLIKNPDYSNKANYIANLFYEDLIENKGYRFYMLKHLEELNEVKG